ncbi:hypothetical protein VXQ18_16220 [Brucella abortus]|nr:hypothetical protein [Brucella abortus]
MDDTLTGAAVDVSGRAFLVWNVNLTTAKIGTFDTELVREFFQAFAVNAGIALISAIITAPTTTISPNRPSRLLRAFCAPLPETDPRQKGRDPLHQGVAQGLKAFQQSGGVG